MPQQEAHQIFILSLCIFVLRFLSHHCSCVLIWIRMGFPCGFRILDPDFTACCELFCILGRWDTDWCGGAGGGPYPRHQRIRSQAHLLRPSRRRKKAAGAKKVPFSDFSLDDNPLAVHPSASFFSKHQRNKGVGDYFLNNTNYLLTVFQICRLCTGEIPESLCICLKLLASSKLWNLPSAKQQSLSWR